MQDWFNQQKPLYPQPLQWKKGVLVLLALAGLMFYYAADVWLSQNSDCEASLGKVCSIVNLLVQFSGVSYHSAEAQFWAAFGLMMLVIAHQIWRHK
jgi:hypothetical protein